MALWTPDLLAPNLDLWWKGDALTGTPGADLTGWVDSSGNGHTATADGNAPQFSLSTLNGLSIAFMDAAFTRSYKTTVTNTSTYTLFGLAHWTGASNHGRVFATAGGSASNFILGFHSSGRDSCYNNGAILHPGDGTFPTTWMAYCLVGNSSTNQSFYRNGTLLASNANAGAPLGLDGTFGIGGGYGSEYSDCEVAEVMYFKSVLNTTDRQLVEGYLLWKWGLQANLPVGHPYANAAPTLDVVSGPHQQSVPFTRGAGGGGRI